MSINLVRRPSGRPRKPKSRSEADLARVESQIRPARRRISGKDRAFIRLFAESGFTDPHKAAIGAGFREPGIGWKLADRLRDLIDAERVRASIGTQMELDEALQLCATEARTSDDPKVRAIYLTLILRYHGALSDKPLPMSDRRVLLRQVAEVVDRIKRKLDSDPSAGGRVKALMQRAAVGGPGGDATSDEDDASADLDPSSAIDVEVERQ